MPFKLAFVTNSNLYFNRNWDPVFAFESNLLDMQET